MRIEPFSHAHLGENSVSESDFSDERSGSLGSGPPGDKSHSVPAGESPLDHVHALDNEACDRWVSSVNGTGRNFVRIHPQENCDKTDKPSRLERPPSDGFFGKRLCVRVVCPPRFRKQARKLWLVLRDRFDTHPAISRCH